MGHADRMDKIIAAAVRQGFKVWQNESGGWFFRRGTLTVNVAATPTNFKEWIYLIGALRGAGLIYPEE